MSMRTTPATGRRPTLLCLAHLEWDHVWQRPQQLMTRLARHYDTWYVDPPQLTAEVTGPELRDLGMDRGVRRFRPLFPAAEAANPDGYWAAWHFLLPELLARAGEEIILWVYSPYADHLVTRAAPHVALVVYDCMDDLASFKDGTPEMRRLETSLMAHADLVFTGGHSMYQARKDRHPSVHCFPSGVDVAHYRQSNALAAPYGPLRLPEQLAAIPSPRLGYFGVLDERIDWGLIAEVAARRPAWHWALVGPFAKLDPAELPRAANIHYLGKQAYADLPAFLGGFDVATMPFALNEATRFISPTKTLEYLAGGRPVLSSSVPDVVATYSAIVTIADGVEAWIAAVEGSLRAGPAGVRERLERAEPVLAANTWDSIAERMAGLLDARRGF